MHQIRDGFPQLAAELFAITEHIDRLRRCWIAVDFVGKQLQRIQNCLLALKMLGTDFIPHIAVDNAHAAHQILLKSIKTE